jgi:ArsR family transcriptional regulator, arsenate/arsenite/antimonite-responsive transcriptional repressor
VSTEEVTSTSIDQTTASLAPEPDLAAVLAALADPTRWAIVQHLVAAQLCTTHLQDLLDTKQSVMSHHLKLLRDAGLVTTEPCGRFTYYRLRPGGLDGLTVALSGLAAASHRGPLEKAAC